MSWWGFSRTIGRIMACSGSWWGLGFYSRTVPVVVEVLWIYNSNSSGASIEKRGAD